MLNKSRGPPVKFEVPTDIVLDDDGEIAMFWHVFDLIEGVLVPVNKVTKEDLRDSDVQVRLCFFAFFFLHCYCISYLYISREKMKQLRKIVKRSCYD